MVQDVHSWVCLRGIFIHALHLPRLFAKGFLLHIAVTSYRREIINKYQQSLPTSSQLSK